QLHLAETKAVQGRAHRGDICSAGLGPHLQQRAALEVDAEIQAVGEEQRDGKDREQRRDREADAAKAREVEMCVVGDDAQRRQQAERRDHGQHGDQDAKANENGMGQERPLRSARFAAASTAPMRRRSGASL
ncbi:hypothetical protein NS44R_14895, partial [Mammaliicoccus sciuri]